jgi:hypothetical protein
VEMPLQLVMGFVMIPLHGGIFQRPIHPLHLTVRPRDRSSTGDWAS